MCTSFSYAQETGKFRGGLDAGWLHLIEGEGGILGAIEFKYNLFKNMNIGLKTEAIGFKVHKSHDELLMFFSATYDYYLHYTNTIFSPFIGAGLGYYFSKSVDQSDQSSYPQDRILHHNNPMCFFRCGLEISKFRFSLDYNIIRKSKKFKDNRYCDYFSLAIGFYIGGGKWKKKLE
jgi:hypothetical protein